MSGPKDDKVVELRPGIEVDPARLGARAQLQASDVFVVDDRGGDRTRVEYTGSAADLAARNLAAEEAARLKLMAKPLEVQADPSRARVTLEEGHDSQPQPQPVDRGKLKFRAADEDPHNFD